MIYLKIHSDIYTAADIEKLKKDYPLFSSKGTALLRIIKRATEAAPLADYPALDIFITTKKNRYMLGKFFINRELHREYKAAAAGAPYIVLFVDSIRVFYGRHCVKGTIAVLLHEYAHFRQWLLNLPLNHGQGLFTRAEPQRLPKDLIVLEEILCRR